MASCSSDDDDDYDEDVDMMVPAMTNMMWREWPLANGVKDMTGYDFDTDERRIHDERSNKQEQQRLMAASDVDDLGACRPHFAFSNIVFMTSAHFVEKN